MESVELTFDARSETAGPLTVVHDGLGEEQQERHSPDGGKAAPVLVPVSGGVDGVLHGPGGGEDEGDGSAEYEAGAGGMCGEHTRVGHRSPTVRPRRNPKRMPSAPMAMSAMAAARSHQPVMTVVPTTMTPAAVPVLASCA